MNIKRTVLFSLALVVAHSSHLMPGDDVHMPKLHLQECEDTQEAKHSFPLP